MGQCFSGAVVCTKFRINKALNNYNKRFAIAEKNIRELCELGKSRKKKYFGIFSTTVFDYHSNSWHINYKSIAKEVGYEISDQDIDMVKWAPVNLHDLRSIVEYLEKSTSDAYLNPSQASFVTKWEDMQ